MIVHLTTSTISLQNKDDSLDLIAESILKAEHDLARDWIGAARRRLIKEIEERPSSIVSENLELVSKSDAIIAEVTHDSFGVGYQTALAIHLGKPVLLLTKNRKVDKMLQGLADNGMVMLREYKEKTLYNIIESFLNQNDISPQDLRFNFFIDREIYNYLRWTAYKTNKSKSRILREIIKKEINSQ